MPRYFFDVQDGCHHIDELGRDLPDFESAKAEAMRVATEFAASPRMLANDGGALIVIMRDERNDMVMTARLALSLEIRRPQVGRRD